MMIHAIVAAVAALAVFQASPPPQESTAPSGQVVVPSKSGRDIHAVPVEPAHAADRLIIRFEPLGAGTQRPALPRQVTSVRRLIPVSQRRPIDAARDGIHQIYLARLARGTNVAALARQISALPGVRYAEPDYRVFADDTFPNDPDFDQLWGLHNTGQTGGVVDADIDAPAAWDISTGSDAVIIGVIDTGIDFNHPDLAANIWTNAGESGGGRENDGIDNDGNGYIDDVHGYDFLLEDPDPSDARDHGTHVAGTIAAVGNDALGITGVNWAAQMMALRFLSAAGGGFTSDGLQALIYAIDNGAQITSNSWGGGGFSQALLDGIIEARDAGVLVVAAAGNSSRDNDATPHYPSSYDVDNVIAVASTDDNDGRSGFSNWGRTSVDIGAPGSSIYSTLPPFVNIFEEDFQNLTPPDMGPQFWMEGTANFWGTIDRGDGNISARGDWRQADPYRNNADGWIITPAMDTRGARGLSLSFWYRYEIEDNRDALIVQVWDGAAWVEIFRRSNSANFRDFFFATRIDIEPYRNAQMQVRFGWQTDASGNNFYGAEIDNIAIRQIGTDYSGPSAYGFKSGTSMATPHVSGVAALVLANSPGMCWQELTQRVISTGDPLPELEGLIVSGSRLNAFRALSPPAGLAVTSPDGGETWLLGARRTLQWVSGACGGTVDVWLLKGGIVQRQIAAGAPNTGHLFWDIPVDLPSGSDYRIRIDDGSNIDESDADFELRTPAVLFVNDDASGANDGSSWEDALNDLQDALDAIMPGDEIWVAAGIYHPDRGAGDRNAAYVLENGVQIYGGFAGDETRRDQRDWVANPTYLSGDLDRNDGPDFTGDDENSYHVLSARGIDDTAVVDGFVITGGNANGSGQEVWGGGMGLFGGSSPTVNHCVFTVNRGQNAGGGIVNNTGSPRVTDCQFIGNQAGFNGGAIYNTLSSAPQLLNSIFCGNTATNGNGGAISSIAGTRPALMNCLVAGNRANLAGGGMWNFNRNFPVIINSTFSRNAARSSGGVANVDGGVGETLATVTNAILWENSDDSGMNESSQIGHGALTPELNYSCVQGLSGGLGGTGNIGADPSFAGVIHAANWTAAARFDRLTRRTTLEDANASFRDDELIGKFLNPDRTQALQSIIVGNSATTITVWGDFESLGEMNAGYDVLDYHIADGSPCSDAADNFAVAADAQDLDGDGDRSEPTPFDLDGGARFVDDPSAPDTGNGTPPIVDMGAFEVQIDTCDPCDMNCDGQVDAFDIEPFLDLLFGGGERCDSCTGDVNGDGQINAFDIEPFLACLFP